MEHNAALRRELGLPALPLVEPAEQSPQTTIRVAPMLLPGRAGLAALITF